VEAKQKRLLQRLAAVNRDMWKELCTMGSDRKRSRETPDLSSNKLLKVDEELKFELTRAQSRQLVLKMKKRKALQYDFELGNRQLNFLTAQPFSGRNDLAGMFPVVDQKATFWIYDPRTNTLVYKILQIDEHGMRYTPYRLGG